MGERERQTFTALGMPATEPMTEQMATQMPRKHRACKAMYLALVLGTLFLVR